MINGDKKIAIIQSNYIPWKGYFDIIRSVDEFVIMDDVQYTRRDWRNRNLIKTKDGLKWLTIPVYVKGKFSQRIDEVKVVDNKWADRHWNILIDSYGAAPYFFDFEKFVRELYMEAGHLEYLSEINSLFIKGINNLLGINTVISSSSDYTASKDKNQRLIDICKKSGATVYLTGPLAKQYIDQQLFLENDIQLVWVDYNGYKRYPQQYGKFHHNVTILDLLFNTGQEATSYLKGF